MKLEHSFLLHPVADLLVNVRTIDQYMDKLRAYAKTKRLDSNTPDVDEWKIIGDGFELFSEFFIRRLGAMDDRLLIKNYTLLNISDNGVDGEAEDAMDGRPVFFQFKGYRELLILEDGTVRENVLTGEHLNTFVAEVYMLLRDRYGEVMEKYPFKKPPRMVVITTAANMANYTKEQKFRDRVECYPIKALKQLTCSPEFWKEFMESVS